MKKKRIILLTVVAACALVVCYLLAAFRPSVAEHKFIADFNSGLSAFEYAPLNPKLKRHFAYEDVEFKATYSKDKIVYTVTHPSEDRITERKVFDDIYELYYDSFTDYHNKTTIGGVGTDEENGNKTVSLGISGYQYRVSFDCQNIPTITYEKIAVC